MIIPEWFLTYFFLIFRSPLYKDRFYPKYAKYLKRSGRLNLFDFTNINDLKAQFPDQVEFQDSYYVFKNVTVLPDGFVRFDKTSFFINDHHTYYLILRNLSRCRSEIATSHINEAHLMCGMYSNTFNFFHFLTDSLVPNLSEYASENLLSSLTNRIDNSFQMEIIGELGIDRKSVV